MAEHKGLVARWLEGKERSEDYARSTLPTNRWSLFWDILKGRYGKLMLVNLIVLVTFLPVIALFIWRSLLVSMQGATGPYGSGLGVGYPVVPDIIGAAEMSLLNIDFFFYLLLIPAAAIAALGISGGMYVIRNMIWTEGVFVANDFWRGVKRNYFNVLEAALFFTLLLFFVGWASDLSSLYRAVGASYSWLLTTAQVVGYILLILSIFVCMWMVTLGVNYKQGFWALIRNAIIMTFGTIPQTVFFGACALLPFILLIFGSGMFSALAFILMLLLSFSWAMLVWMNYSQWAFDKFINPKIGARTGRGIYTREGKKTTAQTDAESDRLAEESEAMREYRRAILAHGKSQLVARPIRPIDDGIDLYQLPESFTREDLQRLRASKQEMEESVITYEEEHKNDERYVEYNRQFEVLETALQEEDGTGKKKKKKAPKRPKMLKK